MQLTYTLTLADFKAAFRMSRRGTLFLRYDQVIWPSASILCFAVSTVSDPKSELCRQALFLSVSSLCFAIGLPVLRAFGAYRAYRASLQNGRQSLEATTEITDERIIEITRGICELTYSWASITGFGQDARITLFRTSDGHILFFPTVALNRDQRAELDELLFHHRIKVWS
jgi:hypothetical protein